MLSAPAGRWVQDESGVRRERVGDYFGEGPLTGTWIFGAAPAAVRDRYQPFTIAYAHRTLAGWLSAVLSAGLVIEAIAEPRADEQTTAAHPRSLTPGSPPTASSCGPENVNSATAESCIRAQVQPSIDTRRPSFMLKLTGFLDRHPALDVPAPDGHSHAKAS